MINIAGRQFPKCNKCYASNANLDQFRLFWALICCSASLNIMHRENKSSSLQKTHPDSHCLCWRKYWGSFKVAVLQQITYQNIKMGFARIYILISLKPFPPFVIRTQTGRVLSDGSSGGGPNIGFRSSRFKYLLFPYFLNYILHSNDPSPTQRSGIIRNAP